MVARDTHTGSAERILDLGCMFAAYLVAEHVAVWLSARRLFTFPDEWAEYSLLLLLAMALWVAVSSYTGIYHSHRSERLQVAAGKLVRTLVLWAMTTAASAFVFKLHDISRQFASYIIVVAAVLIVARQTILMVVLRRLRRFGYDWRTALIIGEKSLCEQFARLLTDAYPMGYHVVIVPVDGHDTKSAAEILTADLPESEDAFLIAGSRYDDTLTLRLLTAGKSVHVVPGLLDVRLFQQALGDVAGIPVISLANGKLSGLQAASKRLADLVGALLLLVFLSPVFGIVAAIIRMTSDGPIFFGQKRLGQGGIPFTVYKFRTMISNAEEVLRTTPGLYDRYVADNFKLPEGDDPRVTSIGAFLRATSLDELPQLLNVLRGDMSLVGPRPVVPAEVEKYGDYARLFLSAKPGMTGHWQVYGRSEITEYSRRVELDLEYIRDQSLGRDFEILLRTVPAVLLRKGAH